MHPYSSHGFEAPSLNLRGLGTKPHLVGNNGDVSLEVGAYCAMCCSHLLVGAFPKTGLPSEGAFRRDSTKLRTRPSGLKLRNDSCVAPPLSTDQKQ
jgi:hypothetical protein